MFRSLSLLLALAPVVFCSVGCSMLSAPDDYAYGGYGSVMPRGDRFYGRVGSNFGPTGYVEEATYDETLEIAPPETPPEAPPEILPLGEEIHVERAI